MKIFSPYGKHVATELKDVYKLASVDELLGRVYRFLVDRYNFGTVRIEELHVAFGIAVRFVHVGRSYYLKFTGRANHRDPEGLFHLLGYLRENQVPLPEVVRTVDGALYENILDDSPYDVTYVMKTLPGRPMAQPTAGRLEGFVNVMAAFHRLGANYRPKVYAKSRNVYIYFREARESLEQVNGLSTKRRELLARTLVYAHEALELIKADDALSKTHIHGDSRFCHVLFANESVSGVIDAEHAEYAERVFDVCMGLISHTNPARCLFLKLDQILGCLRRYDKLYPFNEADRRVLKVMMLCALLNELSGFIGTERSEERKANAHKLWRVLAEVEGLPDELGLAG